MPEEEKCKLDHDPTPWLTYKMMTGQHGWAGSAKFNPRGGYCQNLPCYEKGLHK